MFDYFWWNILVLGMGGFSIYWIVAQRPQWFSPVYLILIFSVLLALVGYTRFGQLHGGKTYQSSAVWQQYLGSKYFKECSQGDLYVSIVAALKELKITLGESELSVVKNLQQPFENFGESEAQEVFEKQVQGRFTFERWQQFKDDLTKLVSFGLMKEDSRGFWEAVRQNAPPTYFVIVGWVASWVPITSGTLSLMPFIDWFLVAVAVFIVFRVFGLLAASGFLIIFCANNLSGIHWMGGGFCRHFWVVALTFAICALEKRKYWLAGAAFGFVIGLDILSFVFLLGACLPFISEAWKEGRAKLKPLVGLLTGAIAVMAFLVFLSFLQYPLSHWMDFLNKLVLHNKAFFTMHLGYEKLAAHTLNTAPQYFSEGGAYFENWSVVMNDRFNEHWIFHRFLALLFVAGAIIVSLRVDPKMASLWVGQTVLFFYTLSANYLYVYLALFGIVVISALKEGLGKGNSLRFWSLFVFLVICNLVGGFSNDPIVLNWWINLALLTLIAVYIFSQMFNYFWKDRKDQHQMLIVLILIILIAVLTFRSRELPATNNQGLKTQVLVFLTKDIESGEGSMQELHNDNLHWPTKSRLLVNNPTGLISIRKYFTIPKEGRYLVTIFYSNADDFAQANIEISGKTLLVKPLATLGGDSRFKEDSYVCELSEGSNSISIVGSGTERNRFLGVNSIILKPLMN